jgi:glycosyltransferase involved in cell wall biosynthesis
MVKAADALHEAGYRVRVVCSSSMPSYAEIDAHLMRARSWQVDTVHIGWDGGSVRRAATALAQRAAGRAVAVLGVARAPLDVVAQAFGRTHASLRALACAEPADLYYGGTAGALAATAQAARAQRVPYGLDLEDFHSAEQDDSADARRAHEQIDRVERAVMPGAAFLTTGSEAMAEAYQRLRGQRPIAINNVFPLPATPPNPASHSASPLRLYWFSQTIGPGRGLEEAVRAAGLVDAPLELHLRGGPVQGYIDALRALAAQVAPRLMITQHAPEPPDPIELCRRGGYDVGLALEQTHVFNRTVCVTNKSFTYLAAGLAVAFTDTPGQHALALDVGEGAFLYPPGDAQALADGLARWANDRTALAAAKQAAWRAAARRWHWDHPLEKGALLDAVARALAAHAR